MMEFIDRTKITELPARVMVHRKPRIAPVIDADEIKIAALLARREKYENPWKADNQIIDAEKTQADHIRIQNRIRDTIRIKDVSELVIDGDNRLSLRRMK